MKYAFVCLQEVIWKSINDFRGIQTILLNQHILSKDDTERIKQATSIEEIRNIMHTYWTFLDYDNLKLIVELKCDATNKERLRKYGKKVKQFCQWNVSEFPPELLRNVTDHDTTKKLHVALDLSDPSLMYINKHLKTVIANILDLKQSDLLLHDIQLGSVLVTFVPVETKLNLKPLTPEQKEVLTDEFIISMKYGSEVIFCTKSK